MNLHVVIFIIGGIAVFTVKNYVVAKDLEEAYALNQKKTNVILGGMLWLKMSKRNYMNVIDLSELGLDQIEEKEDAFEIGCMVTLRQLEIHPVLNQYFNGAIAESLKHIVGVQFRNSATIGGSIFRRFGFSDPLTCFLALDSYVELYKTGRVPLEQFVDMPQDNDILVKIIIKKDQRQVSYLTHRKTATDFPVVTCATTRTENGWRFALGARPSRAKVLADANHLLSQEPTKEEIKSFITDMEEKIDFQSNMRGSEEYRRHLAGVFIERGIQEVLEGKVHGR